MSSFTDATSILAALAEPTRLRLLLLLDRGEVCVCFLQGVLRTNQPKISRHLAILKRAGLVNSRRRGKWMFYERVTLHHEQRRIVESVLATIRMDRVAVADRERLARLVSAPKRFQLRNPPALCAC